MIPGSELEGKYEVLRKIREGGMGAVYEVRHRLLDERRVIKVIHPHLVSSPELAERFRREARAASGLRHPNIAHLHDFSVDPDGRAYIIMELIDGLSLDEILRTQGPPPLGLGLEISRQALRAVGFLHRKGFLHRDIAPDNLMLTRDAEGAPLVKLIDLGIAKVLVESDQKLTMAGTFLGKPRYASPEQLAGESIDGRSDLYSLGIVIYELLTGVCPIQGDNPSALLASHLFQPPLDFAVSDRAGRLPQDLRDLLLKALAKKPEERFAGADAMRERLAGIQARFPWAPEELESVLVRSLDLDETAVLQRRGSTQERLDRQFQKVETPVVARTVPIAAVTPVVRTERLEQTPVVRMAPIPVHHPAPVHHSASVHHPAPPPPPVDPHPLTPSPTRTPTHAGEGEQEGVAEAPRRRKALPVWLAAAAALLVLVVLAAFFLRRDETVEVATAVPVEAKVASEASSSEAPADVPAVLVEPPVSMPEREPEPVPVQPAPVAPEPAPVRQEVAQDRPAPTEKTPPAPVPPVRKPERASEEPAVQPERRAPAPVSPAPKPKPERSRRNSTEEEISFVDPPRVVSMPDAPYPEAAAGSGAKGRVVVTFQVNEKGEVSEAKVASIVIEEGGQVPAGVDVKALFREAALAAARRARFEPAMSDGVPVPYSGGQLTYEF